jgi:hypothetical protein
MSHVYINADPGDEVRVRTATHTDEYVVTLGHGASLYLSPAKAAELTAALIAAQAEREETPNGH